MGGGGWRRLDLLEMVRNESSGQWFLDGSRFVVISKRLISRTLVKTIRFSRLKITRSLIVSSNERLAVTLLCVYASSTCSPLLGFTCISFYRVNFSFCLWKKKKIHFDRSFCPKRRKQEKFFQISKVDGTEKIYTFLLIFWNETL